MRRKVLSFANRMLAARRQVKRDRSRPVTVRAGAISVELCLCTQLARNWCRAPRGSSMRHSLDEFRTSEGALAAYIFPRNSRRARNAEHDGNSPAALSRKCPVETGRTAPRDGQRVWSILRLHIPKSLAVPFVQLIQPLPAAAFASSNVSIWRVSQLRRTDSSSSYVAERYNDSTVSPMLFNRMKRQGTFPSRLSAGTNCISMHSEQGLRSCLRP